MESKTTTLTQTLQEVQIQKQPPLQIVWRNVAIFLYLHMSMLYAMYLMYAVAMVETNLFAVIYGTLGGLGVTAGAHRLWSHRSYKAKWPLRLLLTAFNCIALQNDIYEWSRDHRAHHKFTETNADPHNVNRGFFFAHMGWLMVKKHPDVIKKGKTVDMSDLEKDSIIMFQRKYYIPLVLFFCFLLPTVIPYYLWGEDFWTSFFVAGVGRYCISLNLTWLVNSAAHYYGYQPYDKYIEARENLFVSTFGLGEGFHNYHHTFPYDYSTSELGWVLNMTTFFIDFMAFIGLAYDRKSVTKEMIEHRKKKASMINNNF